MSDDKKEVVDCTKPHIAKEEVCGTEVKFSKLRH